MTTLALLIALIGYLSNDPQIKREVESFLVEPGMRTLGKETAPRLTLRPRDAKFFRDHVQEADGLGRLLELQNPENDAQRLLHENAVALRD